jgi:hypothetical protein
LNERLNLTEKDLRKAAKMQNMVTLYGAGERTGILNVEGKLAKALEKDADTLVVRAVERDAVLNEISARIARYEKWNPEFADELRQLRVDVKDVFNKGQAPGADIIEQLYFLDDSTKLVLDKLTKSYTKVVTPDDFKNIAKIMSAHMAEEVPILKTFTRFLGRLAQDYLTYSKPSRSDFDWISILKTTLRGSKKKGYVLPNSVSTALGLKPGEPVSEKLLSRLGVWKPGGTLDEIINGVTTPDKRRIGSKYFKFSVKIPDINIKKGTFGKEVKLSEIELFTANKLPKSWTNVPSINFDGKIIEQNFTQLFEERLAYKDKFGNWTNNIVQVPQKTEMDWWDQAVNSQGKINDIADATKARTAYGVNSNHSNDATIVKNFHLWGKSKKIMTSSIHDAFFANAQHMLEAREALREIFAKTLESNVIKKTLDEMLARGLPKELYEAYLKEAIETGLIPVPGVSMIGGRVITEDDILKKIDILKKLPTDFKEDLGWYGVG